MGDATARPPVVRRANYTMGQVARACNVAPRTAQKWVDSGLLRGWKIPGRPGCEHRRVGHGTLVAFMRNHGLAVPPELEG